MKLEPGPGNRLIVLSPHLHVCRSPAAHLPHRDAAASSLRARTAFRPPLRPATRPRQPSFLPRSSAVARNRFSSSNNPAASTPANQQWDSQMHCSGALLGYWFVVAGDAAQFRGAHRQLSTTCQTAAPAKRASPGHITHALYTQPSVKRRTLLLLCFLCPPLACAIHDVSSELQSVRASLYYVAWPLVCLHTLAWCSRGSMMVMHS